MKQTGYRSANRAPRRITIEEARTSVPFTVLVPTWPAEIVKHGGRPRLAPASTPGGDPSLHLVYPLLENDGHAGNLWLRQAASESDLPARLPGQDNASEGRCHARIRRHGTVVDISASGRDTDWLRRVVASLTPLENTQ